MRNPYNFRPAKNISPAQLDTLYTFAEKFEEISNMAGSMVVEGRYLSIAQTKLEEASAAMSKAITFDGLK